jgi:hypothetical protein
MTDECGMWKDLEEGGVCGLLEVLAWHSAGGSGNVRIAGISAEIWTEHFLDTGIKLCRYTKQSLSSSLILK